MSFVKKEIFMKKYLFFIFIINFILLKTSLESSDLFKLPEITSSTFITQNLSQSNPDVQIITSNEIKALGINNIPDLLNLVSGIETTKINGSTAEVSLRGFPILYKISPLILIDGMEISENVYDRTYFYNLPLDISDIDRIEVIKNTTYTENGYNNTSGIINIVTKSPEDLDSNYIYQEIGSKFYKKTSFSVNRYFNGFYWKLNGFFKRINLNDNDMKNMNAKFLGLMIDKYTDKSKITLKTSFMEEDLNFGEGLIIAVPIIHKRLLINLNNRMNNLKYFNLLLDYKSKDFDISFYTQNYYGDFYYYQNTTPESIYTNNNFSKFTLKKSFSLFCDKEKLITGISLKYRYSYIGNYGNMKRESGEIFFQNNLKINKNFTFMTYLNNDRTKNLGDKINYKIKLIYNKKGYYLSLGYSRSFKKPIMLSQYFSYKFTGNPISFPWLNQINLNKISIFFNKNKNISSYQIKSTEFSFMRKINHLNFQFTAFHNLIYDTPIIFANLNLFPLFKIDLKTVNHEDLSIHGIDTQLEYSKLHYKFFVNYYYQKVYDRTKNSGKSYFIPKYKLTSGILFDHNSWSGSLTSIYYSSIKFHYGDIDPYFIVNGSLGKLFFDKKLKLSLYVSNIFNKNHLEAKFGERIGRNIVFKVKYNF